MKSASNDSWDASTTARRTAQTASLRVGLAMGLLLALGFVAESLPRSAPRPRAHDGEKINPNEAPVASLMRLPRIGLTRARAISACRDDVARQSGRGPAFTRTEDLQRVKGIGPAIVEDLRPCLQFDAPVDSGGQAPGTPQHHTRRIHAGGFQAGRDEP